MARTKSYPKKNYKRVNYKRGSFSGVRRHYSTTKKLGGMGIINFKSKFVSPWRARRMMGYRRKFRYSVS